jgi:lipoate-protein ligase B
MEVIDLGADVAYVDGLARMRECIERIDDDGPALILIEHRPTITITRRGGTGAFVSPREAIERDGIDVVEADRGGDVTFHGPGQITGYPILRLGPASLGCDVVGYVRALEAAVVDVVKGLGIASARSIEGKDHEGHFLTGVWCHAPSMARGAPDQANKVCAIGVGLGGGVTRHGFALNVSTDLERYTRHIVPCGLSGSGVTSLERLLPRAPSMESVKAWIVDVAVPRLQAWHRGTA